MSKHPSKPKTNSPQPPDKERLAIDYSGLSTIIQAGVKTEMLERSIFKAEVQGQLKSLGGYLSRKVTEYMQDPEHRREFEAWYMERYGKPYEWKTSKDYKGKTR